MNMLSSGHLKQESDKKKTFFISFEKLIESIAKLYKSENGYLYERHSFNLVSFISNDIDVNRYYIKIEKLPSNSEFHFMIKFEETYEREIFLKRRFSYKIMKKLFMTFSHEFGTSLNCILSVS